MRNKILKRRIKIKKRVRSKIVRQSDFPRLSIHRSNNHIYAQVIDDHKMVTVASASDIKFDGKKKMSRSEKAQAVGKDIADQLKKKKIAQVVCDRGAYPYKGRIKLLAESVRESGIKI